MEWSKAAWQGVRVMALAALTVTHFTIHHIMKAVF